MRDPEMVKRAQDVFDTWVGGRGEPGRMGADVLADFAANEVELADAWLRRCFWRAQDKHAGAVARAEKAEAESAQLRGDMDRMRLATGTEQAAIATRLRLRAEKAEAAMTKAHLSADGEPLLGDTVTTVDGRVWCWMPRDLAPVSRAAFDRMEKQRWEESNRAEKAEASHRATLDLYANADARADRAEARIRALEDEAKPQPALSAPPAPRLDALTAAEVAFVRALARINAGQTGWLSVSDAAKRAAKWV